MRIGPMRHRVIIQKAMITQDAAGEEVFAWATHATVWARVMPLGGQERFVGGADQQLATVTHRVEIRHRSDLNNEMRIKWGDVLLDIEGIEEPSGKNQYTRLKCVEVQP